MLQVRRFRSTVALFGILGTALGLAIAAAFIPDSAYLRFQLVKDTQYTEAQWIYERIHFDDRPIREMSNVEARQGGFRAAAMLWFGGMVRENARAAKKGGQYDVETGGLGGASGQQIRGNDAEQGAQREDVPKALAEDGHGSIVVDERVTLSRDGADEGGFAATVGSEDADVFADADAQRKDADTRRSAR